jgi:hypothetical protein
LAKYGEVLGQIECVKDIYEQLKKIQTDVNKLFFFSFLKNKFFFFSQQKVKNVLLNKQLKKNEY